MKMIKLHSLLKKLSDTNCEMDRKERIDLHDLVLQLEDELDMAAELMYDYATGKNDGDKIVLYVREKLGEI